MPVQITIVEINENNTNFHYLFFIFQNKINNDNDMKQLREKENEWWCQNPNYLKNAMKYF